ncbi:hypothetical protein C8Q77DRAFT_207501 [Trametes polyzona]|nr:hypothetical protein C8Q77DRAFT_207501 [Trametes polyzona]
MPLELTAEQLEELLTEERLSDLDPPFPDDNDLPILAPDPLPKRVYHREGTTDTMSIQGAMGMADQTCEFMYLMLLTRYVAKRHVDLRTPYHRQSSANIRRIKKEVLDRAPFFYNYVDAWPIEAYLRSAMKSTGRSDASTPSPPRATSSQSPSPDEETFDATSSTWAPSSENSMVDISDDEDDDTLSISEHTSNVAQPPTTHLPELGSSTRVKDTAAHTERARSNAHPARACQQSATFSRVPSDTRGTPQQTVACASVGATSRATRTASSSTADTVLSRLLAFSLPRADAEHVARVLKSMGVRNVAYLRVFGSLKKATQETLLEERRAAEELTGIQVQVVSLGCCYANPTWWNVKKDRLGQM